MPKTISALLDGSASQIRVSHDVEISVHAGSVGTCHKEGGAPCLSASLQGMMHNHHHHAQEGCILASMLDTLMCNAGVL